MRRCFAIATFLALDACVVGPPVFMYMPADVFSGPTGGCPPHYQARLLVLGDGFSRSATGGLAPSIDRFTSAQKRS